MRIPPLPRALVAVLALAFPASAQSRRIFVIDVEQRASTLLVTSVVAGTIVNDSLMPNQDVDEADDEEVRLRNKRSVTITLTGWVLSDASGNEMPLSGQINAGVSRTFRRNGAAITLNNGGDTITLFAPGDQQQDSYTYSGLTKGCESRRGTDYGAADAPPYQGGENMFLITNRKVYENRPGPEALGSKVNPKGPNELRLAEAEKVGGKWKVSVLPDACTPAMLKSAGIKQQQDEKGKDIPIPASKYVAYKALLKLKAIKKRTKRAPALAFFVHGFNNDVAAVLDRAQTFEDLYDVEVVPFTWPADGGGFSGTLSYRSDKRDALTSVGAFDRAIIKMDDYIKELNAPRRERIEAAATAAHPEDADKWDGQFTNEMMKDCPFTMNLVLHSMGNYIYKNFMSSTTYSGNRLVFDNVVMAAADANNPDHVEWVDRIQCRKRVYITINENDIALRASRMKAGEEQKARLGHWPYNLESRRAVYVNFTDARGVGDSHAYFEGKPVEKNADIREFFTLALNGEVAEDGLDYDVARNMYSIG